MDRWLVLEPMDTVAIRDGRGFDAGDHAVARTVAPQPSTVAGAIGAAFGAAPGAGMDQANRGVKVPREIRGPITVRASVSGDWRSLWPMPRDVVRTEIAERVGERSPDAWRRLPFREEPAASRKVSHDLGKLLLATGDGDAVPGWWTAAQITAYLAGTPTSLTPTSDPWVVERRVGLARRPDRTAAEGMLYAAEHLRPSGRVGLGVLCVDCPPRDLASTVFFGGESRRAIVHAETDGSVKLPDAPTIFADGRLLLYLATPAVFADGWRPAQADLLGADLVSAAVGGPQVIATGRPDRRTGSIRHTRLLWAAPAGCVYFLKFATGSEAVAAAQAWHARGFAQRDETLRTAGFGLTLVGSW